MVKKTYTDEQRKTLLKNKNVKKCSQKAITYSRDFKVKAVQQYQEDRMIPQEIFIQAGFDLEIIGKEIPRHCLDRWKNKSAQILIENRGRTKKTKDKSDKDKIERLEAEVIYLKAENDFLVKLRAKRN